MLINIQELSGLERQGWLQHAIAPRPIAFASTIDTAGNVNLSPFSFFNLFSTNPAIVIFSPTRSVRENKVKHTLLNMQEVPEVSINICTEAMVQQVSLSSCNYPKGVDEFMKAGFNKEKATYIQPPLVKESPIQMECKVLEIKSLGKGPGAGQLVIAEVICMHVSENVLNDAGTMIDQRKVHHVARLGGDWYAVINEQNLFTVAKPNAHLGIGIDALPLAIKNSRILTGNHLAQLANVSSIPAIDAAFEDMQLKQIIQYYANSPAEMEEELHRYAIQYIQKNEIEKAWQILLTGTDVRYSDKTENTI
ncbi:MAG: flavin reductase family protein [Hydrotalea sp. AMD]|uniref:flavin reductase family protein n=1 Tax=Hydrotalea TaxID=1004300 RepID=UPI000944C717|nr:MULTISPECIES: flavin reductase family protein [Hydrotalea]RWZ86155.1 MAG: flavin reductase family protein [Hydrotalea sp. AMD]